MRIRDREPDISSPPEQRLQTLIGLFIALKSFSTNQKDIEGLDESIERTQKQLLDLQMDNLLSEKV
jgi:hypothetical protein